ncbi:anti-sigma factor family protein [Bacillus sp. FSL K6-3431]|uniref:anti-sigma factor family protein n=1 Tax=Bacillus sp. FSL K6-3431 TaxID=2921500 RepID=UPI0030FC6969
MNHMTYEQWIQYVQDELDEPTRTQYENHLYSCDHCLELYLTAVEASESQMPVLTSTTSFTDSVMLQLNETMKEIPKPIINKKMKNSRRQTMIHYMLAAAMTLVLMSTGIFSQLMNVASEFEKPDSKPNSFVSNFLNNSVSITDQLEENLKEGDKK